MEEDGIYSRFEDVNDVVFIQYRLAVNDDFRAFDRNNFTSAFVYKVFSPSADYATCDLAANHLLKVGLVDRNLFCKIKEQQDVLIVSITDGTEQRCYRQLLLTINVSIHHAVDIRCKLNPASLERNNTSTVKLRTIGVNTRSEEYTW